MLEASGDETDAATGAICGSCISWAAASTAAAAAAAAALRAIEVRLDETDNWRQGPSDVRAGS